MTVHSPSGACGGTTSVIEHLAFGPEGCSLRYQIDRYKKAAEGKAVIDYGLHGVFQHVTEDTLREMEELSYREIADLLEVPVGTVMSRLARAREMLKRAWAARQGR